MSNVKYSWHVLAVQNLQISADYFINVLGFEELFRTPGGKSFLKLDELRVMLGDCPGAVAASDTADHAYFAYVLCEDANIYYDRFVKAGAIISSRLEDKPWGLREFNVSTPDGHTMVFGQELA